MKVAAHPGLYDPNDEMPVLCGTRCEACGSVFFPPLGIGCEVCGAAADRLATAPLAAAGVLHSVAIVHVHMGGAISAPFAVAEIQLDDGPLIRGMLAEPLELDAIGCRVRAHWFVVRAEGSNEIVEPRFAIAAEALEAGVAS
jgi:uncharacterized OB-fold protein